MNWIHTEDEFDGRPIEEALETRHRVIEGWAMLTPKQREALYLTKVLGLTHREASVIIGVTRRAVSRRVKRACRPG